MNTVNRAEDMPKDVQGMLADLRRHLFEWLPWPTAGLAFYAFLLVNRVNGLQPGWVAWVTGWVVACALAAQFLHRRHLQVAIYLYMGGLVVATGLLLWFHGTTTIEMALALMIVLLSMNLLGPRSTLGVALAISLLTWNAVTKRELLSSHLLVPLGTLWLTTLVAWLSNRNLLVALAWSWNSFCQAQVSTEEARRHRGELAQALKELDSAYYRLERFSVQLAHARNAAEEARRAKQQFVANVSHELRTPLNIIIGFSEAIVLSPESYGVRSVPRAFMGDINRIYRSAQHLKNLIDDVLDLSKIDAQHLPLFVERTALADIIAETTDMLEPLARQKGLHMRVAVPADLPPLLLDRLRIRQVLLNLLSNAIRFTETGSVTVHVEQKDGELQVSVTDTGPGIPAENLNRVFEEFYQIDAALTKRFDGTGLGLALSRRFVELHGGQMWVESELGHGSRFVFTLPRTPPHPQVVRHAHQPLAPTSQQEARHGPLLLITSAEPMVANFLKRHLQGYQVKAIAPETLEEAVASYLPHAIITNNHMPAPVHEDTKNTAPPAVPVISCPLPDAHHLARALGVDHYLIKPIARDQLLELLAEYQEKVHHILIVDDDVHLCELLARIVRAAPQAYTIDIACGGEEGLARMQACIPDLVLLDFLMPGVNGLDVLRFMRENARLCSVPVVMITAHDLPSEDILQWAQPSTLRVDYPQGFRMSELLRCLQALLDALPPPKPAAPLPSMRAANQTPRPAS